MLLPAGHSLRRSIPRIWIAFAGALAAAAVALAGAPPASAFRIFTVNSTGDQPDVTIQDLRCDVDANAAGDQCTLRAAITQANAISTDRDAIEFAIAGPGVHTIKPESQLPALTTPALIDGYSQPGARFNRKGIDEGDDARLRIVVSGEKLDPNAFTRGIWLMAGSRDSEVRGLVVSGFGVGIQFDDSSTIDGNFVGTDASGRKARPNRFTGLAGVGLGQTTIGGVNPALRNVISGNRDGAIVSGGAITVKGNFIGTKSDGHSPLGNGSQGLLGAVASFGSGVIGGPGSAANVIAYNGAAGVIVVNRGAPTTLSRNRIFGNRGLGVDLGEDGRTANDPGDRDDGPNELQNFPQLGSALTGKHVTTVKGSVEGLSGTTLRVELFANPRGARQARRFIGSGLATIPAGASSASFQVEVDRIARGGSITATATNDIGATSEISDPQRVQRRRPGRLRPAGQGAELEL
jgi:hypothetical protein